MIFPGKGGGREGIKKMMGGKENEEGDGGSLRKGFEYERLNSKE